MRFIVRAAIRRPEGSIPQHEIAAKYFEYPGDAIDAAYEVVTAEEFANVDVFDVLTNDTIFEWFYKDQPEWKARKGGNDG